MLLKFSHLFTFSTALTLMFFTSCKDGSEKSSSKSESAATETVDNKPENVSLFKVGNELFSIPSPVQTAVLIKNSGASYDKSMLNDPKKASSYSTKFQRAMNLGAYGADLGYVTIYDQTQDAISFFNATKRIADELGVAEAFNASLLERFEANMGNQDSLLSMVSDAYRSSDAYLKNNEREDVGAMILCGGYIEALYFSTVVAQSSDNSQVASRIGEQKGSLENLIKLIQAYTDSEQVADFVEELIDLYYLFDAIETKYNWVEPTTDVKTKTTTINSTTETNVTKEQLAAIATKVSSIRNHIIE